MAQSVVMPQSMVPMLGWIMPDPLAMAPMVTVLPPSSTVTAISFTFRSVVRMAWAASRGGLGGVRQGGHQGGDPLLNGLDVQLHPDDAGGADGEVLGPQAGGGGGLGHPLGILHALGGRRRWRCRCRR